jgi:peptidoglycan/xylan/chitin deacetylase (PgdA/CDA1 family)
MSIFQKIRFATNDALFKIGMGKRFLRNRSGGRIIVYHGIDEEGNKEFNSRFISEKYFEQQIQYFKENYHIVSLADYYAGNFSADKLTIAITFDDGYENNFTRALPILQKYEVPATFFVTAIRATDYEYLWQDYYDLARYCLDRQVIIAAQVFKKTKENKFISQQTGEDLGVLLHNSDFKYKVLVMNMLGKQIGFHPSYMGRDYYMQMSIEQLQEAAQSPLITIGSHGYYHNDLTVLPSDKAIAEMRNSKQWLEEKIGKKITAFAFPYGNYTRQMIKDAEKAGYQQILAEGLLFEEDKQTPSLRERFRINPHLSWENLLISLLKGTYN